MNVKQILAARKNKPAKKTISNKEQLHEWLMEFKYDGSSIARMSDSFEQSRDYYMQSTLPANGINRRIVYDYLEGYGFFDEVNLTMNEDEAFQYIYDWWVENCNAF